MTLLTKKTLNLPAWPSYSWPKISFKIYGKTWKWLSSNDQQPTWQSVNAFLNNNVHILYRSRCVNLLETHSCNGCQNVIQTSQEVFHLFFTENVQILFHFDITILCVDCCQKNIIENIFIHFVTQQNVEKVKGCEYFLKALYSSC